MVKNEHRYRPLYAHTDIMGIVNNCRYLEYFEAGRNELMRSIGYTYAKLESKNIGLPLIDAHLNFHSPAKYDDDLRIIAYLRNMPTVRIRIDYEIKVGETLLVDGYTTHSFLDLKRFKPVRPPSDFMEILKPYFK
jgi:acyl-CoA thioester hydrolase